MPGATHQPIDSTVHRAVLMGFLEDGHAPTTATLARRLDITPDQARAALERLDVNHGVVLHPVSREVWVAHPFSASPTLFHIERAASGREQGWWAPCIWCACGVAALANGPVRIRSRLGGESRDLTIEINTEASDRAGRETVTPRGLLAHFPIPAARAWDNVHHFCASTLVFDGPDAIDGWCDRHGYARGAAVPLEQLARFARAWYGRHLADDWRKPTVAEARAMIEAAGLGGPTWELPGGGERF